MKAGLVGLLVALALAPGSFARAADPPSFVRLVYVLGAGTAGCPAGDEFEQAVAHRLDKFPFSEAAATLLVVVVERAPAGKYLGRFFLRHDAGTTSGQRQMVLRSCADLAQSLAIAASVLLGPSPVAASASDGADFTRANSLEDGVSAPALAPDPLAAAVAPDSTVKPTVEPAAVPDPEPPPLALAQHRHAPPPAGPALPATRLQLGVGPLLRYDFPEEDVTPRVLGVALSIEAVRGPFSLGIETGGVLPRRLSWRDAEVSAYTMQASLLPCWRPASLVLCVPARAAMVRAQAISNGYRTSASRPAFGTGLRAGFEAGNSWLRLRPYLGLDVALLRWRFEIDHLAVLREPRASAGFGLDVLVRLR